MKIELSFYIRPSMEKYRTLTTISRKIGQFHRDYRRMPSYSEMLGLLEVRSKSVVHFWVNKLVVAGFLEKDETGRLRPARKVLAIPRVGTVQAGFPASGEETLCDALSLDEYLVKRPGTTFLLTVSGDSMVNEGIREGDLVLVDRGRDPANGDIVIAEVDGEWTMKYFRQKGKSVTLEAANPKYPEIKARSELRLGGVVTAVIRKYHD